MPLIQGYPRQRGAALGYCCLRLSKLVTSKFHKHSADLALPPGPLPTRLHIRIPLPLTPAPLLNSHFRLSPVLRLKDWTHQRSMEARRLRPVRGPDVRRRAPSSDSPLQLPPAPRTATLDGNGGCALHMRPPFRGHSPRTQQLCSNLDMGRYCDLRK